MKPAWNLLVLLALLVGIRLAVAWLYPLVPDEAYYWCWAQRPDWGYFDHPPMIAWIIWLSTHLAGNSGFGVRLLPVLLSGATALPAYLLVRDLSDDSRALNSVLAGAGALLLGAGSVLAVMDVPLLFFISLGLLAGVRALGKGWWWLVFGIALGGALLSKYTGAFLLLVPVSYLFTAPKTFRSIYPWAGLGIACLVIAPNVFWLARHDWVSLFFQASHGLGRGFSPLGPLRFLAEAVLLSSGPLALVLGWGAIRAFVIDRKPGIIALSAFTWLTLLFFAGMSLRGHGEANWPAPAYLSLVILGTVGWPSIRNWPWRVSLAIGLALVALVYAHAAFPFLPLRSDPTAQARGWKELARCVERARAEHPGLPLATARYQEASELRFYMPDHPEIVVVNPPHRPSHFNLWYPEDSLVGHDFLYIGEPPEGCFQTVEKVFACTGPRPYNIFLVRGFGSR